MLFHKLITRGVPVYIVRILSFWYSMQKMKVRWGDYVTEPFYVTNGVKQGGILSPALFILYMNDLSVRLSKLGLGARLAGNVLNHLGYADDLCLLTLTSAGMQRLLDCCDQYALEHDLLYNLSKSVCMLFLPKGHN